MKERERTNAMRLLDSSKVAYHIHTFSSDIHSADEVARILGVPASQVFKTLVVMLPKGRPVLVIIPGDSELDLKKLAQVVDEKKLRMATQVEAEALTGLLVGGISALALLNKGFRIYLDSTSRQFQDIFISAGRRGLNLQLTPADLVRIIKAQVVDIAGEKNTSSDY
jgi:Cys-tRNA(Pro)/Cys-tRNA(Cys) deacylase